MLISLVCEVIEFIVNLCQWLIGAILQWLMGMNFAGYFTPSIDYFENTFLGLNGPEIMEKLKEAMQIIGLTMAILILLVHLVLITLGNHIEVKDTFLQLCVKFAISCLLVFAGASVLIHVMSSMSSLNGYVLGRLTDATSLATLQDGSSTVEDSVTVMSMAMGQTYSDPVLEQVVIASTAIGDVGELIKTVLGGIIGVLSLLVICYLYGKLVLELVQRYMVLVSLYLVQPAVSAAFVSTTTYMVFDSYIKMFVSQCLVIILTQFWLAIFTILMTTGQGLVGLFVIISWLLIGISLEKYMKDMGLSVGQQYGSVLDNMAGAAFGLVQSARMISTGRNGLGQALLSAGAKSGNVNMASMGSKLLGQSVMKGDVLSGMNRVTGEKIPFTESRMGTITAAFSQGGAQRSGAIQSIDLMDAKNKATAIQSLNNDLHGSFFDKLGGKPSLDNLDINDRGVISGKLKYADGTNVGFSVSDNPHEKGALEFTDAYGNSKFFNVGDISMNEAESRAFQLQSRDQWGTSQAEIASGVNVGEIMGGLNGYPSGTEISLSKATDGGYDIGKIHQDASGQEYFQNDAHVLPSGDVLYRGEKNLSMQDFKESNGTSGTFRSHFADVTGVITKQTDGGQATYIRAIEGDGTVAEYRAINCMEEKSYQGAGSNKSYSGNKEKGHWRFIRTRNELKAKEES